MGLDDRDEWDSTYVTKAVYHLLPQLLAQMKICEVVLIGLMRTFTSFHLSSCGWMEASNVFLTLCFAWPEIFNLHFMQAWINHTLPVSTLWKFGRNNCCQSLSWRGFSHKIQLYFMSSTLLLLITQRGKKKKKSVSSSHPLGSLFCYFVDFFFKLHTPDR